MKPIRILFLTDNFPPEGNAPANRTYEHCCRWIKAGAEVKVITCNPNFPNGKVFKGYKNSFYSTEEMNGIQVIRVWSYITKNRGTLKRILDYLSFSITAFIASLFHKTDVIIATSPQLFTTVAGFLSSLFKIKPWIMEVRDLWPESIIAVDAMKHSKIIRSLQKLVNFLYKKAHRIVVTSESHKSQIGQIDGVELQKIDVITNGVNRVRFAIKERNVDLLERLGLRGKFLIGYIGTHGMAHNLDFIIDCASKILDTDIHFLFVGDGAMKGRLKKRAEELRLSNVTMLDPVSRDQVHDHISIIDVALVQLKKSDTFKSVIPSKIFENASMGKPILLGVEGESKKIVLEYAAGLCYSPEDAEDFIHKLQKIKDNPTLYKEISLGALNLAANYDREKMADKMLNTIELIARVTPLESGVECMTDNSTVVEKKKLIIKVIDITLILVILTIMIFSIFSDFNSR